MTADAHGWALAMRRAPLFPLLCVLAFGGAVLAGEADATPHTDGDGRRGDQVESLVLTKATIAAAVRRAAVADPDLDGVVTALEAARYYETRFELLDENHDRAVHGPEFLRAAVVRSLYVLDGFAQPRPLSFESLDVDGNGVLTPEEFLRAELLRRSLAAAGENDARRQAIFEMADANRDAGLSQQEFTNAGTQDFGSADGDGNGEVTIWEFYAATRL